MQISLFRRLFLCALLLLPAACTTAGVVDDNVELSLHDVSVVSRTGSRSDPATLHQLREEVLYEFSKVSGQSEERVNAHLVLEVKEMPAGQDQGQSIALKPGVISGSGQLFDPGSGRKLGEFAWKGRQGQALMTASLAGNQEKRSLASHAARDVLVKIYGSRRAKEYQDRPAKYVRRSYLSARRLAMADYYRSSTPGQPRKLGDLRLSIAEGVLPPEFIGPPDPANHDKEPKVIAAPQLPIQ